ncbi:MAG: M1 family metallopeptidase [Acidobacteriota bacterium]
MFTAPSASSAIRAALFTLLTFGALTACTAPAERAPGVGEAADEASIDDADEDTVARATPAAYAHGDPHSAARPDQIAIRHLTLDLTADFDAQVLRGRASLTLDRRDPSADVLHLDTRDLDIVRVRLDDASDDAPYTLDPPDPRLGRALHVPVGPDVEIVHVDYATRPEAAALQWLTPAQADSEAPFLFSQSQAILARTWVPCQDTPAVRMTYDATVRVPPGLLAVMSAENPVAPTADGVYTFRMPQAIPSYLLAIAAGDLRFQSMGARTGVYAGPKVVEMAAWEFAETEAMIEQTEALYGPYRWGRFDVLVLPPSFPFGGMENPRLTFATPTILARDRSLVALIAHELAHSWSGNLVTNATWDDFWLNEGFTVYLERRIMEAVKGGPYAEMLAQLGMQDLRATVADLDADGQRRDTWLHLNLAGRDPDDGMTDVAYEKGYFLLRALEEAVGRERFDVWLQGYFDRYAFQSLDTATFVDDLRTHLLADTPAAEAVDIDAWIYGPGLPPQTPRVASAAFAQVDAARTRWLESEAIAPTGVPWDDWSTHERLHFLRGLPDAIDAARMAALDATFTLSDTGNSELRHAWLHHVIRNDYAPGYPSLEAFLGGMGRRKFVAPLFERLVETPAGLARAQALYARFRPGYHAVTQGTVDALLASASADSE